MQKIKSLNKAVHFPSFSYSKQQHQGSHRNSFIPKSKQNVFKGTTIETTIGTNVGSRTRTTRRLDLLCEISQRTTASTDQPTIISNAASDQLTIISKNKKLNCVSNMNSNDKFRNPIKISKIMTKRRNFSKKLLNTCEINTKKK